MSTIDEIRLQNLRKLIAATGTQASFAERTGLNVAQLSQWLNRSPDSKNGRPRVMSADSARKIETANNLPTGWLDTVQSDLSPDRYIGRDAGATGYFVTAPQDGDGSQKIEFADARGSCGGGTMVDELSSRAPLVKESSWFRRYKVQAEDAIAVWADGDSMSDFIVDGDIVIFNKRKVAPRSGQIFLIDHPDGLRIKRLRREIDGSWLLESSNPDKRRFPDERITPEQAGLLRILGEFVYRQGG